MVFPGHCIEMLSILSLREGLRQLLIGFLQYSVQRMKGATVIFQFDLTTPSAEDLSELKLHLFIFGVEPEFAPVSTACLGKTIRLNVIRLDPCQRFKTKIL